MPEYPDRYSLLGLPTNALTMDQLTSIVAEAVESGRGCLLPNLNLHAIYLASKDERLISFFRSADFVHADGMSVVMLGRLFGLPLTRDHRVTYVDWMPVLLRVAASMGWKVFYLGSRPGIAERAADRFREIHPELQLSVRDGYFDTETESAEILEQIRSARPDVLIVGMGMPRQELWIQQYRDALRGMVVLPAGAAFDYFAGALPRPPRWAGRLGMEWAFRLAAEPRRLASRYLFEPWHIAGLVLLRVVRGRDAEESR